MDISIDNVEIDPYIYAVGKSFSRKFSGRTDSEVKKIVEKLMKILKLEKQNKDMALLAIGEICNTLDDVQFKLDEKFIEKVGKELALYKRNCTEETHRDRAELVVNVVLGLKLTSEEEAQWNGMIGR